MVKITPVKVSGAFHTVHMQPAQEAFRRALEKVTWLPGNLCSYSNVTGQPYTKEDNMVDLLVRQLCEPVKWNCILNDIMEKFDNKKLTKLIEIGPGRQLKTMVGKVNRRAVRFTENVT